MWKGLFVRDRATGRILSFCAGVSTAIPMLEASPESLSKDFHPHCEYLTGLDLFFFLYWFSWSTSLGKNRIRAILSLKFQVYLMYPRNWNVNQNFSLFPSKPSNYNTPQTHIWLNQCGNARLGPFPHFSALWHSEPSLPSFIPGFFDFLSSWTTFLSSLLVISLLIFILWSWSDSSLSFSNPFQASELKYT